MLPPRSNSHGQTAAHSRGGGASPTPGSTRKLKEDAAMLEAAALALGHTPPSQEEGHHNAHALGHVGDGQRTAVADHFGRFSRCVRALAAFLTSEKQLLNAEEGSERDDPRDLGAFSDADDRPPHHLASSLQATYVAPSVAADCHASGVLSRLSFATFASAASKQEAAYTDLAERMRHLQKPDAVRIPQHHQVLGDRRSSLARVLRAWFGVAGVLEGSPLSVLVAVLAFALLCASAACAWVVPFALFATLESFRTDDVGWASTTWSSAPTSSSRSALFLFTGLAGLLWVTGVQACRLSNHLRVTVARHPALGTWHHLKGAAEPLLVNRLRRSVLVLCETQTAAVCDHETDAMCNVVAATALMLLWVASVVSLAWIYPLFSIWLAVHVVVDEVLVCPVSEHVQHATSSKEADWQAAAAAASPTADRITAAVTTIQTSSESVVTGIEVQPATRALVQAARLSARLYRRRHHFFQSMFAGVLGTLWALASLAGSLAWAVAAGTTPVDASNTGGILTPRSVSNGADALFESVDVHASIDIHLSRRFTLVVGAGLAWVATLCVVLIRAKLARASPGMRVHFQSASVRQLMRFDSKRLHALGLPVTRRRPNTDPGCGWQAAVSAILVVALCLAFGFAIAMLNVSGSPVVDGSVFASVNCSGTLLNNASARLASTVAVPSVQLGFFAGAPFISVPAWNVREAGRRCVARAFSVWLQGLGNATASSFRNASAPLVHEGYAAYAIKRATQDVPFRTGCVRSGYRINTTFIDPALWSIISSAPTLEITSRASETAFETNYPRTPVRFTAEPLLIATDMDATTPFAICPSLV